MQIIYIRRKVCEEEEEEGLSGEAREGACGEESGSAGTESHAEVLDCSDMQCTSPFLRVTKIPRRIVTVPCGQCMACRIARTREWAFRLKSELPYYPEGSCFVTWSYADEYLPIGGSLVKADIQKAFKRLRKELTFPIKYFTSGEYGDESFRPHYHSIILGLSPRYIREKLVFGERVPETVSGRYVVYKGGSVWPFGSVVVGNVNVQSIVYVTGYIRKKLNGDLGKEFYGDLTPPFQLVSQGLGLKWAEDNKEYLQQNLIVTENGKKMAIPRYFKKKIALDVNRMRELASQSEEEFRNDLDERGLRRNEIYEQREKTLRAKVALKKSKI